MNDSDLTNKLQIIETICANIVTGSRMYTSRQGIVHITLHMKLMMPLKAEQKVCTHCVI
jgi:hypothetical protein